MFEIAGGLDFIIEFEGAELVADNKTTPFNDAVGLWIFDCGRLTVDAVALQKFLELDPCKFISIVMNDIVEARVPAKPWCIKQIAYFGRSHGES